MLLNALSISSSKRLRRRQRNPKISSPPTSASQCTTVCSVPRGTRSPQLLQRIPRPLSPLATSKITVTMPFIRGTVEEMIFLERYNVWKDNRYGDEEDEDND